MNRNYRSNTRNRRRTTLRRIPKNRFVTGDRWNKYRTILDNSRSDDSIVILNQPGRVVPDRTFVKLKYIDSQYTRGNTGSRVSNWSYQSSVNNVENGSGLKPVGISQLQVLYRGFRVHSMFMSVEVSNPLSNPIVVVIWPSQTFAGANTLSFNQINEFSCAPQAKVCLTGNSDGNSLVHCSSLASARQIFGPVFARDDDYAAFGVVADPADMFYINVAIINTSNANMSALIPVRTTLELEVECFEKITLQ